ncbi:hypothetical protein OCOL_001537 [Ordospora colligata]|uniref:Condensin complex subunit 2 n=1 Tax=Ordospora colligata OC4 TaxID=1354746 RepID=A0A0B2UMM4_9MICR|nr:uncharacterized protein M896_021250 [Ordospora colligata OC4]KHN70287.1 hypothetical protein M896_021250 [Ordospora colligata OC4]TBU16831.1 hypothetical protein CWI41_021260 [Ordospora colligata]TBU16939.1 hypothetical protein CWI40_021260 [Ordospora colligata]
MSTGDLRAWLKAAAENKITTKNTWKATLIDHFTNIDEFKERHGINFQKAGCALDGCAKVYSTRVDDVSESAMRLLEGFGGDDALKKRHSKKQSKVTIEKNIGNLNVKISRTKYGIDPKSVYLSSLPENSMMLSNLGVSMDGVLRMGSHVDESKYMMLIEDIGVYVNLPPDGMLISPSITTDNDVKAATFESTVIAMPDCEDSVGFDDLLEFENIPVIISSQKPVFNETSFSYFKGWAGPGCWKVNARMNGRKGKKEGCNKQKETVCVDFTEPVDSDWVMEPGNTLFEPACIVERREKQHLLPQDYSLKTRDLYKYIVMDGMFCMSADEELRAVNRSFDCSFAQNVLEEPMDEAIDVNMQSEVDIKRLIEKEGGIEQSRYPFRKAAKRVDIKKLKDNVFGCMKSKGCIGLASIFKGVYSMYNDSECKDISVHLCFLSLLHLANERNVCLKSVNDDVEACIPV